MRKMVFSKLQQEGRQVLQALHMPLAAKLFICYILLAASMFAFLNTYGISKLHHTLLENKYTQLHNICSTLADHIPSSTLRETEDLKDMEETIRILVGSLQGTRIWFADKNGNILYDSKIPRHANDNILAYDETLLGQSTIPDTAVGGLLRYRACVVVYPLVANFEPSGYIISIYPLEQLRQEDVVYIDIYNLCYLFYCIFLALIFFLIYIITIHPLHKNIRAVQMFSKGNYDYRANIHTRDEHSELAESTAFLARELKDLEEYQKKIIANVSHDFRSPLTSIKGYAEAMADGTIPLDMQEKYLGVIVYETTRLTKLTQNLLSLNNYENRGLILTITHFDINEAIRRTALSFEGTGRKKGIRIHLVFEEPQLFVSADIEKIEQVLYNLLDNAIKFSYKNRTIRIATKQKGSKAMISVKDNGIGIPKESLSRVFERFYKTDASRGKDKKGTGLGLAIVKDIITAHKETITVVSTEGAGTEFTFSLEHT